MSGPSRVLRPSSPPPGYVGSPAAEQPPAYGNPAEAGPVAPAPMVPAAADHAHPGGLRSWISAHRAGNRRDDRLRQAVSHNQVAIAVSLMRDHDARADTLHYRLGMIPVGRAAVHVAAKPGKEPEMMTALLDNGANPGVRTASGKNNALHVAVKSGNEPVARLLAQRFPELLVAQNKRRRTPFALAAERMSAVSLTESHAPAQRIYRALAVRSGAEEPGPLDSIPLRERQTIIPMIGMERIGRLGTEEAQAGLPYFTGPQLSALAPASLAGMPAQALTPLGERALSLTEAQWEALDRQQRDQVSLGFNAAWNARERPPEDVLRMSEAQLSAAERMGLGA